MEFDTQTFYDYCRNILKLPDSEIPHVYNVSENSVGISGECALEALKMLVSMLENTQDPVKRFPNRYPKELSRGF